MRPTGVPRLVRLGEPQEAVDRGKSVRNHPHAMQLSHAFSRFSVCSSDFWPSIAWTCTCTPRVSEGAPSDEVQARCRRRTGFGTTYGQSCRPVWRKYRTCRTHKYGRLLDHARLFTGPKSSEVHFWKLYIHIVQPRGRRRRTGQNMEKSYKSAARSSAQSD